jgi:tetratricopeptide (TPR) repeat protein
MILLEELGDPERAELAFGRAVERDIRRGVAFDKLFRMVRARKDGPRLLDLIGLRLDVAEDPEEIAKLFWERARVLRGDNRIDEALTALENVTMLEPDHVGALALSGEIYIKRGMFAEAAENLARLAKLDDAPRQQRLMSGVAAVDIFEKKLGQMDRALEVLIGLYQDGLSTLPVRERLARTAARVGSWESATAVLEELMAERDTSEGRIEAARLAMAIYRDRLEAPPRSEAATARLLAEDPGDGEALDLVLSRHFSDETTDRLLAGGLDAVVEQLQSDPLHAERIDRLARIAAALGNAPLRQACLGSLVAVGEGTPQIDEELNVLDQRVARLPQIAIDESALPDLCDPEDGGPIGDLMQLVAPTLAEALGPNLQALGVTRRDRVDPSAGLPIRNEISAWAGALGVEFDLYVGGKDDAGVFGVATDRKAIVVGAGIQPPLAPRDRAAIARELFALRRGTTIVRHRDPTDVAAIVVALCNLAGQSLPSPHYAMLDEFQRLIGRAMPRKVRRSLPELATKVT